MWTSRQGLIWRGPGELPRSGWRMYAIICIVSGPFFLDVGLLSWRIFYSRVSRPKDGRDEWLGRSRIVNLLEKDPVFDKSKRCVISSPPKCSSAICTSAQGFYEQDGEIRARSCIDEPYLWAPRDSQLEWPRDKGGHLCRRWATIHWPPQRRWVSRTQSLLSNIFIPTSIPACLHAPGRPNPRQEIRPPNSYSSHLRLLPPNWARARDERLPPRDDGHVHPRDPGIRDPFTLSDKQQVVDRRAGEDGDARRRAGEADPWREGYGPASVLCPIAIYGWALMLSNSSNSRLKSWCQTTTECSLIL